MTKFEVTLTNLGESDQNKVRDAGAYLRSQIREGKTVILSINPAPRNNEQNALMWKILNAFAKQLEWPVNGAMVKMNAEDWKDVLTAAFRRETVRLAAGVDSGVVMLGLRTSKFTKTEFAEFLDFLTATATLRGVKLPAHPRDAKGMQ